MDETRDNVMLQVWRGCWGKVETETNGCKLQTKNRMTIPNTLVHRSRILSDCIEWQKKNNSNRRVNSEGVLDADNNALSALKRWSSEWRKNVVNTRILRLRLRNDYYFYYFYRANVAVMRWCDQWPFMQTTLMSWSIKCSDELFGHFSESERHSQSCLFSFWLGFMV